MSYICNTTFVMAREQESEFLSWLRSDGFAQLFSAASAARTPVLAKVTEHCGQAPLPEHGLSIALHVEFEDIESLHEWCDGPLAQATGEFMKKFGPHVATFTTTLEIVPL